MFFTYRTLDLVYYISHTPNYQTASILLKSLFLTLGKTKRLICLPKNCFRGSNFHNQWMLEMSTTPMRISLWSRYVLMQVYPLNFNQRQIHCSDSSRDWSWWWHPHSVLVKSKQPQTRGDGGWVVLCIMHFIWSMEWTWGKDKTGSRPCMEYWTIWTTGEVTQRMASKEFVQNNKYCSKYLWAPLTFPLRIME